MAQTKPDSSQIVFTPAGTGAVATTVQQQLRNIQAQEVYATDAPFYAIGNGVANDTTAIQAALNSGSKWVVIPSWAVCNVTGLTLAENQTLEIRGKLKMTSGAGPVVLVNNGCTVIGGEIDVNSVASTGIAGVDKSNVTVHDVFVHHAGKVGIVSYKSVGTPSNWTITGNRVEDCTEQGISVEYTNDCLITGNRVTRCLHGIQWWGGDSNVTTTKGIYALRISDNICSNVLGGIWGSCGQNISVVNNHVENCTDVGIDFEGCSYFTCTGNTAYECNNGSFAIFYGCSQGVFSSNTARNSATSGSCFYATTNATYSNEYITIANNKFYTQGNNAIYATQQDGRSLGQSAIVNNEIVAINGAPAAITLLRCRNIQIDGNRITTVGNSVGINLQGVLYSHVCNNMLYGYSDTSPGPSNGGGIWLYQQNSTWPAFANVVTNNRVEGYVSSIVDSCASDVTLSQNYVQGNQVTSIYRTTGATYTGNVTGNIKLNEPKTAVNETTY